MEYKDLLRPEIPEDLKRSAKGIIIAQKQRLHPVVAKLVDVLSCDDSKSNPLRRQLVITNEGGALAAVSNKRMLDTLEVIGDIFGKDHFTDAVSAVYCSSAGVANGAVFMPHVKINGRLYSQTFRASARYPEQFAGDPFNNVPFENGSRKINWKLIWDCLKGTPIVDVGFLVEELNKFGLNPPDQSPNDTRIVMIGTKTDKTLPSTREERRILVDKFASREEYLEVIRKMTFIPFLSGMKLPDFVDGGLVDLTGISTALEEEGKDVNVLALTNIPEDEGREMSRIESMFMELTKLRNHGLPELLRERRKKEGVERVNHWRRHYQQINLCMIAPPNGFPSISPLEKNKQLIRAAGDRAVGPVLDAFGITQEYGKVREALLKLMPFPNSVKIA